MGFGKNDEWVLRGRGNERGMGSQLGVHELGFLSNRKTWIQENLDSSLTGKLRNQIGLLSPSVLLLPHLFNLERIAAAL